MTPRDVAELAQTLFEEMGDAAFIVDPSTMSVVEVNPVAQRMTGAPRQDLLSLTFNELFRSDQHDQIQYLLRSLQTTQTFHSREGYYIRVLRMNTWLPVNLTLTRLHTERGRMGLILVRDISDRIQIEEQLRETNTTLEQRVRERTAELARLNEALQEQIAKQETAAKAQRDSEERFRAAFDDSAVPMLLADLQNQIVRVNNACGRLFGVAPQRLLGMNAQEIIHPDDRLRSQQHGRRILAGQTSGCQIEKRYRRPSGTEFWALTNVALVRDAANQPLLFIRQIQDITESKLATQRLAVQNVVLTMLAEANQLATVAPRILATLATLADWTIGVWWFVSTDESSLHQAALWHVDEARVPPMHSALPTVLHANEPSASLAQRVWSAKESFWLVNRPQPIPFHNATTATDLQTGFAFPLLCGSRVLGVIEFFSVTLLEPDTSLIRSLETLGVQIGQFIERQRTDEQLRLFRALIDQMMDGVEIIEPETGRVLDVNQRACLNHGYTREEYLQLTIEDLDPEVAARTWANTLAILQRNPSTKLESEHWRKDGTLFPVEIYINLIELDRRYYVAVVRDITERKHAQRALEEAQDRLTHVVTSSPTVLFTLAIIDERVERIRWISANLYDRLGHQPEAAYRPQWWEQHVHPEDLAALMARGEQELFKHGSVIHEYRFRHGDGMYRWTRSELRLVRDAFGQAVEAVGSWSDITERKLWEDHVRQVQKMEAIGRLAGGVAHDFNNLLTIINGYSEILLSTVAADNDNRLMLREVIAASERAGGLTRQLLSFSRKAVIEPRILDLNTVVTDVDRMLQRIVGEDILLTIKTATDLGTVKADASQMEQVLLNLVVNARDALPRGGQITIEVQNIELGDEVFRTQPEAKPGPYVLLAVSDNGIGMDQATIDHVFEPFFTTKGERGTGIGLATVHGIVKQSGGLLTVYSELGSGTTFKIYLPRVDAIPSSPSRFGMTDMPKGIETILFVEDEEGVRLLIRRVLERCGYNAIEAHDGQQALQLAAAHQGTIHLLLTDVIMPVLGGRELAERMATVHPESKVLYMSGYTDDAIVRHGVLEAQVWFLQKPFAPFMLAAKIREVLDS